MMNKPHVTVAYDADFVRELGGGQRAIIAALLYNLICLFSNPEEDGWCPITHKVFEARTTFKRDAFIGAQKILIDGGYIEKQVRLREGTFKKATYFRPLQTGRQSIVYGIDTTMSTTQTNESPVTTPVLKKKVKVNSAIAGNGTFGLRPEALEEGDFSSLSDGERSEPYPMGNPVVVCHKQDDEPFSAPVERPVIHSVKPEGSKKNPEDSRAWAIVNKIVKKCQEKGMRVNPKNVKLQSAVKFQLTKAGRTEQDIMFVLDKYLTTDDKFYSPSGKSIEAVFGQDYFEIYLNMDYKPKQKPLSYTF